MDGWRKQKGKSYRQEGSRGRSINRRPPTRIWRATVPSWEKNFCSSVGAISWREFLEGKKYIHLYDNVVQWDDSAGEEAFRNAKNRYWAEINNLPSDISMPDPDIYIDEVDWNAEIDQELVSDLDHERIARYDRVPGEEDAVPFYFFDIQNPPKPTGWGDDEENPENLNESSPWDDSGERDEGLGERAAEGGWGSKLPAREDWTDRGWRNVKKEGKRVKFVYDRSAMLKS